MTKRQIMEKIPFKLLTVFLLLSAGIAAGGFSFYKQQRARSVAHSQEDLNTIAQLKSEEITVWRRERYGDAYVLTRSQQFAHAARNWYKNPGDKKLKEYIYKRLDAFRIYETYKDVILVDPAGKARMFIDQRGSENLSQATLDIVRDAERQNRIIFSDFYYCGKCQEVHLDVVAPLHDGEINAGAIILRINPDKYLYPLIQRWPSVSKSGETVLLRREGQEMVVLNELRFKQGTAMKFRLPITDPLLPATMVAMGKEGTVEGYDYRIVQVVAAIKHITDSPWYMVTKMDKEEIYAPLRRQAASILFMVILTIILLAAVLSFIWQADRRGFYKKQYQLELDKQALVRHFDYLTKYANDITLLSDDKYKLVEVNDRAVQTYGYSREEMLGRNSDILRSRETRPLFNSQMEEMQKKSGMVFETLHQRKDGSTFPVEVSARLMEIEGKRYLQAIVRDISERKQFEQDIQERNQKLGEANRALGVLNQCSFELASLPAGKPVYDVLTRYLKEMTGGCAVTFGEYDRGAKEIAVKQILMEKPLLLKVEKIMGRPLSEVRSPVSPETYAIMMSEGAGVRHTLNEITFGAVPKLVSSAVGALMGIDRYLAIVYQTEGQLYGTSVVALKKGQPEPDHAVLKAFGSLGAVSLRRAQAEANLQASHEELQASYQEIEANNQDLQVAEEELKNQMEELAKSEKRYHSTLDNMLEGCQIIDKQFKYIYLNEAAARHGRKSRQELLGKTMMEAYPGIESSAMFSALKSCLKENQPKQLINEFIYSDSSKGFFDLSIQPEPEGVFILSMDITERKEASDKLQAMHEELQASYEEIEANNQQLTANNQELAAAEEELRYQMVELQRRKEEITNAKNWSDTLIQSAPNMVIGLGERSKILLFNSYAEKLTGYKADEVLGKNWIDLFIPEELRTQIYGVWDEIIRNKHIEHQYENLVLTKNKETRLISWNNSFLTENGQFKMVLSLGQDITEQKKAENKLIESEIKFRQLAENIDMVFWLTDWTEKKLLYVNQAYERVFGFTVESAYSDRMGWKAAVHPDDLEWVGRELQRHALNEEFTELEYRITCRGKIKWIHEQAFPLKDETGKVIRFINVADDITERKLAEEKSKNQLSELQQWQSVMLNREDRVMELKDEVNRLLKELGRPEAYRLNA